MKKQITFLLLMATLLSTAACGGETGKNDVTTAGAETTSSAIGESADPDSRDSVPSAITEDLDFKGATITVLTRDKDEFVNEFKAGEETGDTINDAVYARNLAVEDKLKVKLEVMSRNGDWGQHTQFNADVIKEVMAGDTSYDVISYYAYAMPMIASEKVLYNLKDLDHIDLTKPWWHQKFIGNAEVYGKLYAVAGDIDLSTVSYRYALFFNKTLAEDYLKDIDLYKTVLDYKWTQEYLINITKDIYSDLDGDGVKSTGDFFGLDGNGFGDPFPVGGNVTYTKKTADGGYEWNLFTEHNNTIMERFYDAYNNNIGIFFEDVVDDERFFENRCIFVAKKLNYTEKLREMKNEYGILPMPMFDEAQEHYYSLANDNYSQIAVPATVKDPEAVGAFLELMGEYSYKIVTPKYYEVAMKGKYLRDDESCQMFDIIIDGAWYDFANINTSVIGDPVFITRQAQYHRDGKNFASMWASRKDELTEKLNSLLENYKNS